VIKFCNRIRVTIASSICIRYALQYAPPPQDTIQNVDDNYAMFDNGVTIVQFSRDMLTNDATQDLDLNICHYLLFAWGDRVNVSFREIQYHGSSNRAVSDMPVCFPSAGFCPEKCKLTIYH